MEQFYSLAFADERPRNFISTLLPRKGFFYDESLYEPLQGAKNYGKKGSYFVTMTGKIYCLITAKASDIHCS